MITITEIIKVLSLELSGTNLRILIEICKGIFRLTGKVTTLNISRYTDKGGSYRNLQRFFSKKINWKKIKIILFENFLYDKTETYVLASDECTEDKSGKSTHGINRFFSSIVGKVIPGIAFLHFSLINLKHRDSYSIDVEQIIKEKKKPGTTNNKKKQKNKKKKKRGRPKGSKNKNKSEIKYHPLLRLAEKMLSNLKKEHAHFLAKIRVQHFVGDGAYGNNNWVLLLEKYDLKLISKLHYNAALYLPYSGAYCGLGQPKKYGNRINIDNISSSYLVKSIDEKENDYIEYIYQIVVLSKNFRDRLNVIIIIREDRKTGKKKNVILFSNDLELSAQKIIDIYSLRFQIEFNFRDAKQFFGLSDFKNIKENPVTNAINLSLFMTLISKILLQKYRTFFNNEKLSINDLKSLFRADMYISKILKNNKKNPMTIFNINDDLKEILTIGIINGKLAS